MLSDNFRSILAISEMPVTFPLSWVLLTPLFPFFRCPFFLLSNPLYYYLSSGFDNHTLITLVPGMLSPGFLREMLDPTK